MGRNPAPPPSLKGPGSPRGPSLLLQGNLIFCGATVLALELVGGTILSSVVYAVFGYVMPWLGLERLDMAPEVATFDQPAKIIAGA
jgi:hypothetical protein